MPVKAGSGTKGLIKRHNRGCDNQGELTRCECPWRAKYKDADVSLAAWSGESVNPREKAYAKVVLGRVVAAVDAKTFRRDGEQRSKGSGTRLDTFIRDEWKTHHVEDKELSSNSLASMMEVVASGSLGPCSLDYLANNAYEIEKWLSTERKARRWSDNTWNRYYELLSSVLNRAIKWKKIATNPMPQIDKRKGTTKKFGVRIEEDIEDRLFEACDALNRPQHRPNRSPLTQQKADTIRKRAGKGEPQTALAQEYGVSPATICGIVKGETWTGVLRIGTKGTEMKRRLIAAFDSGVRAGEMMLIQLKHQQSSIWELVDGVRTEVYVFALPPEVTKGGKTTGEIEYIYFGTTRAKHVIDERRLALKNDPDAFPFGNERGEYQKGFRRMWCELFKLAGLRYGRAVGLVWHTTRHEYISRLAENEKEPALVQELARHKDLKTTQGYMHNRRSRVLQAAVGLSRRGKS